MKIIITDNYGRDNISEQVFLENLPEGKANQLVSMINVSPNRPDTHWYVVEHDDYKPYTWEP